MIAPTYRFTLSLLLLVGAGLIASGCLPLGIEDPRTDRRYPDSRYPDRYPDSRYPDSRRTSRAERVVYSRVSNDADRYVRSIDRALRLDRRQEQRIARLLSDRAFREVRSKRSRDVAYPFPRRAADRATAKWWRDADRRIERELDRRQRRIYKDMTRQYERSARRDDRRRGRHDNGRRRRGGGN